MIAKVSLTSMAVAAVLSGMLGEAVVAKDSRGALPPPAPDSAEMQSAAARYVANLKSLLATQIVPGLRRGISGIAASKPSNLTVEVTDDPSPFSVGAQIGPNDSLTVRLSLGYTTLHDAALDAVALSAALHRPQELRPYLIYQLRLARENDRRRRRKESAQHAMTFAEFVGIDAKTTDALFAQREWRVERDHVEIESLGWTVAYLLVQVDPKLAGESSLTSLHDGEGAARITAAAGWFPVPPVATALGLSEISWSRAAAGNERSLLCRAARLMESGVGGVRASPQWQSQLAQDTRLQERIAGIDADIARMRHDGACESGVTASL